jgi:citrate synthase
MIRTDIAWSTPSTITVKGFDLCKDILGTLSLGDIAFLELTDCLPTTRESVVFNAIAVTLIEHGLTPSAIAARMTYTGAPEAMQAAVASELKLPWRIVRGIGVMARAIGLVGHIREEMREPMAREIKARAEEEATAHLRTA